MGRKEHMIQIQKMLFKNKIPSINMNYRLVSTRKKITYKQQLEDISSVIDKFNSLSEKAELQPDNYIILGESAGGHLALLYGYQHPDQIKKIISLSGPTDFYSPNILILFIPNTPLLLFRKL
jgi:acetyl esterase/lipase